MGANKDSQRFQKWYTHYDLCVKKVKNLTIPEYTRRYQQFKGNTITQNRGWEEKMVRAEVAWMNEHRPYYKVHENIVDLLLNCNLKKIPISLLEVPRDLDTVNIAFQPSFHINGGFLVSNLDVIYQTPQGFNEGLFFLIRKDNQFASIDFRLRKKDVSIEEYISEQASRETDKDYIDLLKDAIKIYVMLKFLRDCPNEDLINYDVLLQYKDEYFTSGIARKKEIEEESRRKGRIGWNVGVSQKIIENCGRISDVKTGQLELFKKRELSSSHIRKGHLHAVRFGANKAHVKIMFFRPIVVRPDLKFIKENQNG